MSDDRVKARWNGPFDAQIGPGLILKPGDEYEVTPGDLLSGHWVAVGKDAKAAEKELAEQHEEAAKAALQGPEPAPDAPTDETPDTTDPAKQENS